MNDICPHWSEHLGVRKKCGLPVGHDGDCCAVCSCGYIVPKGSDGWHSYPEHTRRLKELNE